MEMLDKLAAKCTSAEAASAIAAVLGLVRYSELYNTDSLIAWTLTLWLIYSEDEDSQSYLAAYSKEVNAKVWLLHSISFL